MGHLLKCSRIHPGNRHQSSRIVEVVSCGIGCPSFEKQADAGNSYSDWQITRAQTSSSGLVGNAKSSFVGGFDSISGYLSAHTSCFAETNLGFIESQALFEFDSSALP